jgi:hypothetical protein
MCGRLSACCGVLAFQLPHSPLHPTLPQAHICANADSGTHTAMAFCRDCHGAPASIEPPDTRQVSAGIPRLCWRRCLDCRTARSTDCVSAKRYLEFPHFNDSILGAPLAQELRTGHPCRRGRSLANPPARLSRRNRPQASVTLPTPASNVCWRRLSCGGVPPSHGVPWRCGTPAARALKNGSRAFDGSHRLR